MSKNSTPISSTASAVTDDLSDSEDVIYLPQHITIIELDSSESEEEITTTVVTPKKNQTKTNSLSFATNNAINKLTNSDDVIHVPPYVPFVDLVTPPLGQIRQKRISFKKRIKNAQQKIDTLLDVLHDMDLNKNQKDKPQPHQPIHFHDQLRTAFPDSTENKYANIDASTQTRRK